jgi:hypothetical protein
MHDFHTGRSIQSWPGTRSYALGRRRGDAQWAFARLVEDLGYQHRMLSYEQIEQGMLDGYRVLLMPACAAISRKEAEAIHRFVEQGGPVLADTLPGFLEDDCYLRPTGGSLRSTPATPLPRIGNLELLTLKTSIRSL